MHIKFFSIVLLAVLTISTNSQSLAGIQYSNNLFTHDQSVYCAETSSDENKENEEAKEEEEEPDCD